MNLIDHFKMQSIKPVSPGFITSGVAAGNHNRVSNETPYFLGKRR